MAMGVRGRPGGAGFVERWRELGILAEDVEILAVEVEDEASVPEGAGPWVLAVARDGIYRQPVDDPGTLACWKSFGAWRMWLARAGEALAIRVVAVSGGWVLHEAVSTDRTRGSFGC